MSDFNDGLLQAPCLRMNTHFGDEYESIEFGDGTGYVKAAPMLARIRELGIELDGLRDENAKLRELLLDVWNDAMQFDGFWNYVNDDGEIYNEDELPHYYGRMRELGVEVDG